MEPTDEQHLLSHLISLSLSEINTKSPNDSPELKQRKDSRNPDIFSKTTSSPLSKDASKEGTIASSIKSETASLDEPTTPEAPSRKLVMPSKPHGRMKSVDFYTDFHKASNNSKRVVSEGSEPGSRPMADFYRPRYYDGYNHRNRSRSPPRDLSRSPPRSRNLSRERADKGKRYRSRSRARFYNYGKDGESRLRRRREERYYARSFSDGSNPANRRWEHDGGDGGAGGGRDFYASGRVVDRYTTPGDRPRGRSRSRSRSRRETTDDVEEMERNERALLLDQFVGAARFALCSLDPKYDPSHFFLNAFQTIPLGYRWEGPVNLVQSGSIITRLDNHREPRHLTDALDAVLKGTLYPKVVSSVIDPDLEEMMEDMMGKFDTL